MDVKAKGILRVCRGFLVFGSWFVISVNKVTSAFLGHPLSVFNKSFTLKPPPPGGVLRYYVPSSRTLCKRTPLEGFVPGSSRGVLLHTVLDEGNSM